MYSPHSDGSAYDYLVDSHCFPTIYADDDEHQRTPRSARAEFFSTVAADRAAAARSTWDADTGTVSGSPSGAASPPSNGPVTAGGPETPNVSGARATHPGPA